MNKRKIIRISVLSFLGAINSYVIYALIMNLVVWLRQPRFNLPGGGVSASLGFMVQFFIYLGIFLITLSGLITALILFYKNKKKLKSDFKTENYNKSEMEELKPAV